MYTDVTLDQVKILAKQLKIPTFGHYPDILRQLDGSESFGEILLMLMKNEYEQRQENQMYFCSLETGYSVVRLSRLLWEQEVACSNQAIPTRMVP